MDKSLIAALLLFPLTAFGQTHTMPGSNVVPSGASLTINSGGSITAAAGSTVTGFGAGGGAPTTATYVTQTPDGTLSAELALSTLSTGLLKSTTSTGALTTITDNSTNWNTAFTQVRQWDGGATGLVAATGLTSLGGTTVGQSFFTLTNPSAITFPEISATNVVSTKTAAQLKTDLSLTATDVGLSTVTNNAQTQAAIVPNTAPSAGQILIGNAGGTAYAKNTLSGSGATMSLGATGTLTISAIAKASITGAPTGNFVGDTDTQTLSAKTLTAPIFSAGSATAGSWPKMVSGTLLTTPEAGAEEWDGAANYFTNDTTSGREYEEGSAIFRLTADAGAGIGGTIADFFGTGSAYPTVASAVYEIICDVFFTKTTAGTVTFTITNSQTYTNIAAYYLATISTGISASGNTAVAGIDATTTAAAALPVSTSLTTATDHHYLIKAVAETNLAGTIKLQVTCGAGTVTPRRGSWMKVRRMPNGNVGKWQ